MKLPIIAILCAVSTPAFALTYDEAVSGDITGDEGAPTDLGALAYGMNVVRGHVDPVQDSFTVALPPGAQVLAATLTVTNYQSLGQNGQTRFFQQAPFQASAYSSFTSDGTSALDLTGIGGFVPLGFTAASMGPSGAVYDYELQLVVGRPCTGGVSLWNEAFQGDITGDEIAPTGLADLAPGTYVVCGQVDAEQDSVEFGLLPDSEITSATMEISGYQTYGQDGYSRVFQTSPFSVFSDTTTAGDGIYPLDLGRVGPANPVGFSAASVGPLGAAYEYKLTLVVDEVIRPRITTATPPVAGSPTTFALSNLSPGQRVYLVGGTARGSTPVPMCPGTTSGIAAPRLIASGRATPGGTFSATVPLPAGLTGRQLFVQALDPSTCDLSFVYPSPL